MTQRRPHIIVFNPDQWRGDVLGHLGNEGAHTPVLDDWVRTDAVSFRNAFTQSPVCTPSRCSFMSGWYPHVRGHRTMHHMMRPNEPVLLRTLKENGYFVWWGGKNDLVPAANGHDAYCDVRYDGEPVDALRPLFAMDEEDTWRGAPGSDTYYSFYVGRLPTAPGEPYYDRDWAAVLAAVEQIRTWGERARIADGDVQPLCLYLPIRYPHPPYAIEDPWFGMIDRSALPPRVPTPTEPDGPPGKPRMLHEIRQRQGLTQWPEDRWTALRATYYAMCARVDHQFGLVLSALREAGLYDDAAVFFFSDHGDFTGDYGLVEKTQNTFEDCLSRVPFLVKPPAGTPIRPRVTDALAELVDFSATVEDLTGIEPAHSHFGRSLLSVIAGDTDTHRDAVFCEGGRRRDEVHAKELESRAGQVPTGLYWPRLSVQSGPGDEHTKAVMCRTAELKYVRRLYEDDELYDLHEDPFEQRNVAADPRYADRLAQLVERTLTWYQETCDVVPLIPDERG